MSARSGASIIWGLRTASTTRANTSTSTWAAPARSSARAQVSTVAPEVSTSSTSTSRRPATVGLALGRHPEGALHVVGALGLRQADLLRRSARTRLSAPCSTGTPLMPAIARASAADWLKRRAHSRAPMQRHRHQRVGLGEQFAAGARHPAAHHRRKIEPVAVFEAHAPARARRRRSAPRRARGHRPADRRSPPSTAGRGRDRRRTGCRAARNRAAR